MDSVLILVYSSEYILLLLQENTYPAEIHSIMRIVQKGNNNTKRLAYTALVRPTVECGAVCWDRTEKGIKWGAKKNR